MQNTNEQNRKQRASRMHIPQPVKTFGKWMGRTAGALALVGALSCGTAQNAQAQSKGKEAVIVSVGAGGEKLALPDSVYVDGQKYSVYVGKKSQLSKTTDQEFGAGAFVVVPKYRTNPDVHPVIPVVGFGGLYSISYSNNDFSTSGSFSGDLLTAPGSNDFRWLTYWAASGDAKYGVFSISVDVSKLFGGTWDNRLANTDWNLRALASLTLPFYSKDGDNFGISFMGGPQLLSSSPTTGLILAREAQSRFKSNSYVVGAAIPMHFGSTDIYIYGLCNYLQTKQSGGNDFGTFGFRVDTGKFAIAASAQQLVGKDRWSPEMNTALADKLSTVSVKVSYTIPTN